MPTTAFKQSVLHSEEVWTCRGGGGESLYGDVQVEHVHVWSGARCTGGPGVHVSMYGEVQSIMGNAPSPVERMTDGQTRLKTLLFRNLVGGW